MFSFSQRDSPTFHSVIYWHFAPWCLYDMHLTVCMSQGFHPPSNWHVTCSCNETMRVMFRQQNHIVRVRTSWFGLKTTTQHMGLESLSPAWKDCLTHRPVTSHINAEGLCANGPKRRCVTLMYFYLYHLLTYKLFVVDCLEAVKVTNSVCIIPDTLLISNLFCCNNLFSISHISIMFMALVGISSWISSQFWWGRQTHSVALRVALRLSFLIKLIVWANSGLPWTSP